MNKILQVSYMMTSSNGNIFALLAICAGNSPVPGEFPTQRPVTRSFNVFFDLRPNKRSSKQSWGWWFETPSCSLWRHGNVPTLNASVQGGFARMWQGCPSTAIYRAYQIHLQVWKKKFVVKLRKRHRCHRHKASLTWCRQSVWFVLTKPQSSN